VNLIFFKTPIFRVAVSAVLALAVLALPSSLPGNIAYAAPPTFGTFNGFVTEDGLTIKGIQTNGGNAAGGSLNTQQLPEPASFTVTSNGKNIAVVSVNYLSTYLINLVLASPVFAGAVVTFSYTAPANDPSPNNKAIQDPSGNDAASFGPLTVTANRSEVPVPPSTPATSGAASWDTEPLTDSETDSNTVGFFPNPVPGTAIITNEFGFVVGKKNDIKPRIRMKNYAGTIAMTLTATYKEKGKTKKYTCKFAPFGTSKKLKTAAWRWYTPKKACVLPPALVTSIQTGKSTLSAKATWKRQWFNGKKTQPNGKKIKARKLKYTLKGLPG
jgi:hypothetical protein